MLTSCVRRSDGSLTGHSRLPQPPEWESRQRRRFLPTSSSSQTGIGNGEATR
ncbi:hypothetical protein DPMN_120306 [Dreissena polymorpha]|uniref:Uncharacterized protein n=1 Tax=Dreissena polymorpha TaxID=45954 RepID=A0A9D4JQ13_DREPO|nr:hypothetical protein DPMN_120306 [Dreissena polymorpha]